MELRTNGARAPRLVPTAGAANVIAGGNGNHISSASTGAIISGGGGEPGSDDKTIATVDADSVALAAIQALDEITRTQASEISRLREDLSELRALLRFTTGSQAIPHNQPTENGLPQP